MVAGRNMRPLFIGVAQSLAGYEKRLGMETPMCDANRLFELGNSAEDRLFLGEVGIDDPRVFGRQVSLDSPAAVHEVEAH